MMAPRQGYGALFIRFIVAPLLGLFSGFHTMDFIMGGIYTWPQMSRVFALTLAIVILSYEFVYKENRGESGNRQDGLSPQGLKATLYSCLLPYMIGVLVLLSLAILSQRHVS
ncbi:hypothetical protein [Candidatus Nitrospira salsa]